MGKGEIARYMQFLLFPQRFQKACFPGASKGVIGWEWVNTLPKRPWSLHVCSTSLLKPLKEKEKLLLMSNFSSQCLWKRRRCWLLAFSHSIFKRPFLQRHLKLQLCGKEFMHLQVTTDL